MFRKLVVLGIAGAGIVAIVVPATAGSPSSSTLSYVGPQEDIQCAGTTFTATTLPAPVGNLPAAGPTAPQNVGTCFALPTAPAPASFTVGVADDRNAAPGTQISFADSSGYAVGGVYEVCDGGSTILDNSGSTPVAITSIPVPATAAYALAFTEDPATAKVLGGCSATQGVPTTGTVTLTYTYPTTTA
jgi:hypothetical protein